MIETAQAHMLGIWLENQPLSHAEDLSDELKGSEDGIVKVSATIAFRRVSGSKFQIKCKFKIPRDSIEVEDVFDAQMTIPGM